MRNLTKLSLTLGLLAFGLGACGGEDSADSGGTSGPDTTGGCMTGQTAQCFCDAAGMASCGNCPVAGTGGAAGTAGAGGTTAAGGTGGTTAAAGAGGTPGMAACPADQPCGDATGMGMGTGICGGGNILGMLSLTCTTPADCAAFGLGSATCQNLMGFNVCVQPCTI